MSLSRNYYCSHCGALLSAKGAPCGTAGCPGNIYADLGDSDSTDSDSDSDTSTTEDDNADS